MVQVLVVCTANVCRSPLAAALLERLGATVRSAGTLPETHLPVDADAVRVGAEAGLDIAGHRPQGLSTASIIEADLVLGMAREHVREVVALVPSAWSKTFTLKELVRSGEGAGPRRPGEPIAAYLARVGDGRQPADLLGTSSHDDIADPYGRSVRAHRRTLSELTDLTQRLDRLIHLGESTGLASRPASESPG